MKTLRILTAALVMPILVIALMAAAPIHWGVTPNTKEQTPQIPKGAQELLTKHNGIFVGDTTKKEIFLTFDLGYEAGFTAEVLDILKEHNIKGNFFLCGNYIKEKDLIMRMINEGHIIGNHTDKHKELPTLSEEAIRKDINDFTEKFNAAFADSELGGVAPIEMKHFRPGKGRFDERTIRIANELNLKTVMWSIAIVDWAKTAIPVKPAVDKVVSRLHPGAIALFHITNSSMPDIIRGVIAGAIEKGYAFGDATAL